MISSTLRVAVLLLCTAFLFAGCDSRAAAVETMDRAYDAALESHNGETAVTFVSKESLERLDRMVELARTADKKKVKSLPYADRFDVLLVRLLLQPTERKRVDGRTFFVRLVEAGWVHSTSQAKRVKISVTNAGDAATITYRFPGETETVDLYFVFEDGGWKEDRVRSAFEESRSSDSDARAEGMTEDEMLFESLAEWSGREVPDSVWDP